MQRQQAGSKLQCNGKEQAAVQMGELLADLAVEKQIPHSLVKD